jgi:hypothetical protein
MREHYSAYVSTGGKTIRELKLELARALIRGMTKGKVTGASITGLHLFLTYRSL